MAASIDVSIVIRHIFLTAAITNMLASDCLLYHTSPKCLTVPTWLLSCVPLLIWTCSVHVLGLMLDSSQLFFKTETVDWLSSRIQVSGIRLPPRAATCWKVKLLVGYLLVYVNVNSLWYSGSSKTSSSVVIISSFLSLLLVH